MIIETKAHNIYLGLQMGLVLGLNCRNGLSKKNMSCSIVQFRLSSNLRFLITNWFGIVISFHLRLLGVQVVDCSASTCRRIVSPFEKGFQLNFGFKCEDMSLRYIQNITAKFLQTWNSSPWI